MTENELSSRLERVYGATDLSDLEQAYDHWAEDYDIEVSRLGYLLRAVSTGYIARYTSPDQNILDAGAGTGLIGSYLAIMGYRTITAIDLSSRMLEHARRKECYQAVHRMVLGEDLGFESDQFDATYAVGVFTEGHAPPNAFEEIFRVTKPGGRVVFSIREDVYRKQGYERALTNLEHSGICQKLASSPVFQPYPQSKPEVRSRVLVYESV